LRTGQVGEKTAEAYLEKQGYEIVQRNFSCKKGEIDLIVRKKNTLIFVEVKTRNTLKYGLPHESITPIKIKHIKSTAHWYINANKNNRSSVLYLNENLDFRFDVVEVLRINNQQYVKHTENAF
jgi:putative endonuclease